MTVVKCKKCDRNIVEQAKFCSYCGERAAVACSSCGVLNPTDGLFCHDCGRSLAGEEVPPEPAPSEPRQPRPAGFGCPRCHVANEPGSTYCYQCGLPLEGEQQLVSGPTDAHLPYTRPYESARIRANWTTGLLIATCITYGIHMLATFNVLRLVSDIEAGRYASSVELDAALVAVDGMSILLLLAFVSTAVVFLMWNHRVSRNLQSLGAYGQRFSPAWAVGWWFIPIMFLFRPYQVVAEIERGSEPSTPRYWKDGPVTPLMPWWWMLWLASLVTGAIASGLGADVETLPSSTALGWDLLT